MPIPDYESIMLPLLKLTSQEEEISLQLAYEELAKQFQLSPDEKGQLLPSGGSCWKGRVGWAKTYMIKAGLLKFTKRSHFKITERGLAVIKENLEGLDSGYLKRFPEFMEFQRGKPREEERSSIHALNVRPESKSPDELLRNAYLQIRQALADELLEKVKSCSPSFFEWLVVELLVKMGYGGSIQEAGKVIGKIGDGGIDGVIKEDKLGLDLIYIQAKRWENNVGRPQVQAFAGALQGVGAKKGILVTTSDFTEETKQYVKSNTTSKIVLIDGKNLADLMIDYDIGVSKVSSYEIKRLDSDYFSDE